MAGRLMDKVAGRRQPQASRGRSGAIRPQGPVRHDPPVGFWRIDALVAAIGAKLVEHAVHTKWEARKAVAHTIQYLRDETFHAAVARLLKDAKLREEMGRRARATVLENFLMSRLLEQDIDLLNAFEIRFHLKTA